MDWTKCGRQKRKASVGEAADRPSSKLCTLSTDLEFLGTKEDHEEGEDIVLELLRAEREAEIAANKQAVRQRMIDRQVAYLQSMRQNENERIAGQVRNAEAKRDAEISAKNAKLKAELAAMRESHRQQMQQRSDQRAEDLRRGNEDARKFRDDYEAGVAADRAAEAARRQKRIELRAYHVKQAKQAMARRAGDQDDELAEQELVRMKLLEEDLLFEKYSQALIAQYKAEGKEVKPLLIELAKMKAEGR